eukprot:g6305.t1
MYSHACQSRIVVIGGGLAGLTAALESTQTWTELQPSLQDCSFEVVILEKESRLGGNSVKASSGINGLISTDTEEQDSFLEDTRISGGGLSSEILIKTLVKNSKSALEFLRKHGVDLSGTTRLGGHSKSRTRFNPSGANVGFAIMKQLMTSIENNPFVKVTTSAKVTSIKPRNVLTSYLQKYTIKYEKDSSSIHELIADAVVIATGGFGANKTLLELHAPRASVYATTNGPWSTGDGLYLGEGVGGVLIHLEEVQVHPTGFVDPNDPNSGSKILAAEKLRGCGAIMLNSNGHRFVDELNRRDHVFSKLSEQDGEKAWLVLSDSGGKLFNESHMGFYKSRGLIKKHQTLKSAAEAMNISETMLKQELQEYNIACQSGVDVYGKKTFPSDFNLELPVFVSMVTPVVHYTMGGLLINEHGQLIRHNNSAVDAWLESKSEPSPIVGIYAAGEVTGGLHGKNRLGGNSLLDCVVFGRICGKHSTEAIAQGLVDKEL